jgi:hypothetical protein
MLAHARDETIEHHGQMNGSPRDVTPTHREGEKFLGKAILFLKCRLQTRHHPEPARLFP